MYALYNQKLELTPPQFPPVIFVVDVVTHPRVVALFIV